MRVVDLLDTVFESLKSTADPEVIARAGSKLSHARNLITRNLHCPIPEVSKKWIAQDDNIIQWYQQKAASEALFCTACHRPWSITGEEVKACARCKKEFYCSRGCQKSYVLELNR